MQRVTTFPCLQSLLLSVVQRMELVSLMRSLYKVADSLLSILVCRAISGGNPVQLVFHDTCLPFIGYFALYGVGVERLDSAPSACLM